MTSDHLFPVLESESQLFAQVGALLAIGNVPAPILEGIRLGRMTALKKPDGGVRGIVVGDIIRRFVARTMAKQVSKQVEAATAPFQYALSTKAGCECVAHILQCVTEEEPEATVISIDGVGAYGLISRNAMLEGLLKMENGDQILPFSEMFLWEPINIFIGRRDGRHPEHSTRGGRGARRSPHANAFCIRSAALLATQARLLANELDDMYAVCRPDRCGAVFTILQQELQSHAEIQLHHGKTQVWNRGGVVPSGIEELTRMARRVKPEAVVWRGDPELPLSQQGMRVLGVPIGQPEFVRDFLERKNQEHERFYSNGFRG